MYFVFRTIPFGWKASTYLYHTIGQYIDHRHIGQLAVSNSSLIVSPSWSDFEFAEAAVFMCAAVLVSLGYFLGLSKSTLIPSRIATIPALHDDTYNFCQRCGFGRGTIPTPDSSSSISVDLKTINDKLAELKRTKSARPYEKQKTSIQSELISFLASLSIPKLLPSASSMDILKLLVWKDRSGRTKVHQTSWPEIGKQKTSSCNVLQDYPLEW